MKLLSPASEISINSAFDPSLSSSFSSSAHSLWDYVKQRKGRITQNLLGRWLIEIPSGSLGQTQNWILEEYDEHKWLLVINEVPQFFFSTEAVLHLLKI